ncbi:hypothetical protein PT2222_140345 [Paraburkholderia tropica]
MTNPTSALACCAKKLKLFHYEHCCSFHLLVLGLYILTELK